MTFENKSWEHQCHLRIIELWQKETGTVSVRYCSVICTGEIIVIGTSLLTFAYQLM